ncbi:MAG: toll/interleukin-1 receptor domain-containing protein [Patescibacteria group bacterium]
METIGNVPSTIRIFLSYSTKDKELAGRIKSGLESYGIEIFLAHEDIIPSHEWQEVILRHLDSTDIFIPIITDHYKISNWTDQECGIAFARRKKIMPLAINGENPYGFIARYQSLNFDTSSLDISLKKIINAIRTDELFKKQLLDSIIKVFAKSNTFKEAGEKAQLLTDFDEVSNEQIIEIISVASRNEQIYSSSRAVTTLRYFFSKNQVHPDLLEDFESRAFTKQQEFSRSSGTINLDEIPF